MKNDIYKKLSRLFAVIPGIGEKQAQKISIFLLKADKEYLNEFSQLVNDVRENVFKCPQCHGIAYKADLCSICSDNSRKNNELLIVESYDDMLTIENLDQYHGFYFILNGLISPLKGITPDELNIHEIIDKLSEEKEILEITLALPKSSEGNVTSYYIKNLINKKNPSVKVYTLAEGLSESYNIHSVQLNSLAAALKNKMEF